jgi:hypothetical protein
VVGLVILATAWISFLGMEAYLFAFLLVLGLSLFFAKYYFLAGLTTGLLFLARGEGILVLFVQLGFYVVAEWPRMRRLDAEILKPLLWLVLGFSLPAVVWFVFATMTFGSVLPNTLGAKQAMGQSAVGRSLFQRLAREWMPTWGRQFSLGGLRFLNLWWLLAFIGLVSAMLFRRRWLAFGAWIVLYIAGYTLLQVSAAWWYQLPILFVLQLFFALGLVQCLEWLLGTRRARDVGGERARQAAPSADGATADGGARSPSSVPRLVRIALSIVVAIFFLFGLLKPAVSAALNHKGDPRGETYAELSRWLRENAAPTESVAFVEIGYLGFYTSNQIIDLAGLVLPEITPHVASDDYAWGFWHYEPDYFVYLPDFDWALAGIRADPRFDERYQPVTVLPGPRESDFVIFKRR